MTGRVADVLVMDDSFLSCRVSASTKYMEAYAGVAWTTSVELRIF
jgi:hypothetical protein